MTDQIILAERIFVPASLVPLNAIEDYKATIKSSGEESNWEFYKYVPTTGCYEFARGKKDAFQRHFGALPIRDQRSAPQMSSLSIPTPEGYGLCFRGQLRPNQEDAIKTLLSTDLNGILKAPPRFGKTITVVHLACRLRMKALFLSHNIDLSKQMLASFRKYSNALDLEYLAGRRLVDIVGDWDDLNELDIAIMNYHPFIQNPSSLAKLKSAKNLFGAVFVDEVHRATAPTYSSVVSSFNSRVRLGLSCSGSTWIPVKISGKTRVVRMAGLAKLLGLSPEGQGEHILDLRDKAVECLSVDKDTGVFEWKQVTHWHRYINTKTLVRVRAGLPGSPGTVVTTDHSLVVRGKDGDIRERSPEEIRAKGARGQYTTIANEDPRYQGEPLRYLNGGEGANANRYLIWLIGFFLRSGSFGHPRNGVESQIVFKAGRKMTKKLILALRKSGLAYEVSADPNIRTLTVSSVDLFVLLYYLFPVQKVEQLPLSARRWPPRRLPPELFVTQYPFWLLAGLSGSEAYGKKSFGFRTESEGLARDIGFLLLTLGVKYEESRNAKTFRITSQRVVSGDDASRKLTFTPAPHEAFVYDLSVDKNENFVGNNLVLHNTGTVERKDGMHIINEYLIGPVLAVGKSEQVPCQVRVVRTNIKVPRLGRTQKEFWTKVHSHLSCLEGRNELIVQHVAAFVGAGHYSILVSDRTNHIESLARLLRERGIVAEVYHGTAFKTQKQRDAVLDRCRSGETQVLVANRAMTLGIDLPRFSAFFNTTPTANAPNYYQEVCRVRTPFEGKQVAHIVDFVDDNAVLEGCYKSRLKKVYEEQGFEVYSL